ncbi:MAG TPA: protein-methionine-sulfoxide reductase heme-binding subunit MsrQ [Gemmatimonadales bacterium]|nr:protein-methionine-sulfoxide reductase heme-binding subunit MsrQ [Gemmatimonadales bacterium]
MTHPLIIALGLLPAAFLLADALSGRLGANPIETLTHTTGDWTIWLLLATLAVTPLRRITGWNEVIRFRRTLGLLAFGYGCAHFLIYLLLDREFVFDPGLALASLGEDIAKRPYITVGFTALLLLAPLAVTSSKGWIRRLGGRRWNALHRLIYVAAALGVLHYLWLVKGDQVEPVWHGLLLVALLSVRVWDGRRRKQADRGGREATLRLRAETGLSPPRSPLASAPPRSPRL